MKKILLVPLLAIALLSCGDHSEGAPVETSTASDTITNVTNPGVGAVSDDTARKH